MPRTAMKAILLGAAAFSLITGSASDADLGAYRLRSRRQVSHGPSCYAGGQRFAGGFGQKDLTD